MGISIRSPGVEYLARRISARTGDTMTDTIEKALAEMDRGLEGGGRTLAVRLRSLAAECAGLPDLDCRGSDEILGYGPDGTNAG